MSDENKTREELLEELRALRAQVQQDEPAASADTAPRPKEGMTRREALETAAWVAPVILSVSLSGTPAQAQRSQRFARGPMVPTPMSVPTSFPTSFPTPMPVPTASPTSFPTSFPTSMAPTPVVPVELQTFKIE